MALVARLLLNCLGQKHNLLVWDCFRSERNAWNRFEKGRFQLINKLAPCSKECKSRPGQRCGYIQLNDSMMWFCSVKLNSGLTRWLCPWSSWWLFLLSGFLWQRKIHRDKEVPAVPTVEFATCGIHTVYILLTICSKCQDGAFVS